MNIGLLYSGIYWQEYGFKILGWSYKKIFIYSSKINFENYDIIIVPKGIHQKFLIDNQKKIIKFVEQGGVLVCFGEMDGNWLPNTCWISSKSEEELEILNNDYKIFKDIKEEELAGWHKTSHGYFRNVPERSKILVSIKDAKNQVVCFINDTEYRDGAILVTTIDPDYHTYTNTHSAEKLFTNIIVWSEETASIIKDRKQRRGFFSENLPEFIRQNLDIKIIGIEIVLGVTLAILLPLVIK